MKKLISRIKQYKPSKYICYLYFFIPIFVSAISRMDKENDTWFLLNHGKYVLENGFPIIEPFSMHKDFSFVMQQWLSSIIFYIGHSILGQYGILIVTQLVNILILYFLYKLCMLLSENKFRLSIVISCITDVLLLVFMVPRPWIFTMLFLIITLYIMELYYKKNNSKILCFLPLISILQINFQSSMWFMIYLFMLPYIVCLIIDKIRNKKNNKIYGLLIIILFMFVGGIINPYGIDNILYVFNSYGNQYIDRVVYEMLPVSFSTSNGANIIYSILFYFIFFVEFIVYSYGKKGKFELRHFFLFLGVTVLGLKNIRNIWLFMIGTIPFLASYLKEYFHELSISEKTIKLTSKEQKKYLLVILFLSVYTVLFAYNVNKEFTSDIEKGIDKICESNNKNVVLYTNYDNGSYAEYRGLRPYIDTRAEVFTKKMNKKEDIMKEYYLVTRGYIKYEEFVDKYKFTHMLIMKNESIYKEAVKDEDYKVIFKDKKYVVLERKNIM